MLARLAPTPDEERLDPAVISEDSLRTLEFETVVASVAEHAGFSGGRERVQALQPLTEAGAVRRRLDEVSEARSLLDAQPDTTIGGARDVRAAAQRAGIGSVLRAEELLDIAATLEAARDLKAAITKSDLPLPLIREWGGQLQTYPEIVNRINQTFNDAGEVLDSASARLRQLRRDIRTAHGRIVDKLNGMIASPEYRSALQDPLVTMRNGRYVLPVRSDARSRLPGIVHDQSASGQTAFVEPLAVTELNNHWTELQIAEQREVERILDELSRRVGQQADGVGATVDALADLDCAFARAKYAAATRASPPDINPDGPLKLIDARHPLLTGHVVPISLSLGEGFRVLVITGPNTGGKTVALKTVGLLTLMAQAGLQVPAAPGSSIALTGQVWADIGDEQSIEQSLSTFSSHLSNIVKILAATDERSLVLLDELGAGTDPQEGSGLARAIIRELLERGALAVVTTHYSELKAFAHEQEGAENASVEFDVATLSPTYRLVVGVPGRSQALAIAKRLGLPASIVERARSYVSQGGLRVERLLSQIQQEREALGALSRRATELNEDLAKLRDRLLAEVERTKQDREAVLRHARSEGAEMVRALRARLGEIERSAAQPRQTARRTETRARRQQIDEAVSETLGALPAEPEPAAPEAAVPGDIGPGDEVRVESLGQIGTVSRRLDGEFEVQVGAFKLRRAAEDLVRIAAASAPASPGTVRVREASVQAPLEMDIRGRRPHDIEPDLDRYVNDSYLTGLETLKIIHGHGSGVLRRAVREQLEAHPLVAEVRAASRDQGGDGVTIATLAR